MGRFLHLADLHLGASFSFLSSPEKIDIRKKDFEEAFIRAIDFALSRSNYIDAVWIVGDLFDSLNPPSHLVSLVKSQFARLKEAEKDVVVVPGTHDPSIYPDSVYRNTSFEGVTLLNGYNIGSPVCFNYQDVNYYLYGMEYHPHYSEKPFSRFKRIEDEGFHIALIHGSLVSDKSLKIEDRQIPLDPYDLAQSGMDYIGLGHYHNYKCEKLGESLAVYPGTLEGRKFNELNERYLVTADFSDAGVKIDKHLWNKRTFKEITIDVNKESLDNETEIIKKIQSFYKNGKNLLLKINLTGITEFVINTDYLYNEVSHNFFYSYIKDNTDIINSPVLENIKRENSVRGLFVRKMLKRIPKASGEEKSVINTAFKLTMKHLLGGEALEV